MLHGGKKCYGNGAKVRRSIRKQFLDMLDNANNNLYNSNKEKFEDVNYDKTSEEKYSRDIDYSEYLYLSAILRKFNQLMFYIL